MQGETNLEHPLANGLSQHVDVKVRVLSNMIVSHTIHFYYASFRHEIVIKLMMLLCKAQTRLSTKRTTVRKVTALKH